MEHSVVSPSLMAGIFEYFTSLTRIFSNYRFDGHIWLITCESTHDILPETRLKSYLPFFPGSLRGSKMLHSVASPSLMAGIF